MLFPSPGALHASTGRTLKQLDLSAWIELLPVALGQFRFVIKRIDLAGSTRHEELDDALGFRCLVRLAGREQAVGAEQMGQGDAAEAAACVPEELSSGQHGWCLEEGGTARIQPTFMLGLRSR